MPNNIIEKAKEESNFDKILKRCKNQSKIKDDKIKDKESSRNTNNSSSSSKRSKNKKIFIKINNNKTIF